VEEGNNTKLVLGGRSGQPGVLQDCLFLSLAIILSALLYIRGMGFYDDDWVNLLDFTQSQDQSLLGIVRASDTSKPAVQMRPVDVLYYGSLYWVFGLHPFGYHAVNTAILAMGILLFYLVLREMNINRLIALAVPLMYGLLPHYSTNRFWFAAFAGNLSMALYFSSLYCDLRTVTARPKNIWEWRLLSLLSLLGSTLAYEHFLPLFFLNPLIVLFHRRQLARTGSDSVITHRKLAVLLGSGLFVLVLVVCFKVVVLSRFGRAPSSDLLERIKYLVEGAVSVSYRRYGTGLPRMIWRIIHNYPSVKAWGGAGIFGFATFAYLYSVGHHLRINLPRLSAILKLIGFGFVVFALGYSIFLTSGKYGFSVAGPGNRIAIAAAVGVAFTFVGGIAWLSSVFRSQQWRRLCYCVMAALVCSSGFLIINTTASFWKAAYSQQRVILADIYQHVPSLPPGSTLILDGVCPYNGPAVVFHSQWDLKAALMIEYHYTNIEAAVVTPNLKVNEDGLSTFMYGDTARFRYRQLYVYNFGRKATFQLQNAEVARRYFAEYDPDYTSGCPNGNEGDGVPIF
jgi:hypothetical protein